MAEEETTTDGVVKEETTPEETVSDEQKFDAQEAITGLEQKISSELGRAQKTQQSIDELKGQLGEFMTNFQQQQTQTQATQAEDNYISTESDVVRIMEAKERQKVQATAKYNADYNNEINKLAMNEELSESEATRFEELTKTSFNKSRTDFTNSSIDAESNFDKCMRIIEKERASGKKVNLAGADPTGAGVVNGTNQEGKEPVMPKLDEHAEAFVKSKGFDAKKVTDVLKGTAPGGMVKPGL